MVHCQCFKGILQQQRITEEDKRNRFSRRFERVEVTILFLWFGRNLSYGYQLLLFPGYSILSYGKTMC
jgi:hypothetical protein